MKTTRTYNNETITANWKMVDAIVNKIVENDSKHELDVIGISLVDVKDGVLADNFTIIAAGENRASFELEESVGDVVVEWARDYEVPSGFITLWEITI